LAGYQTIEALRPILHRGPVPAPVVNRALVHKPRNNTCPTYAQIEKMVELRSRGESIEEIVRQVGFTRSTVRRHTALVKPPEGGWKRGGRAPRVSRDFIFRLNRCGFTQAEIAQETGYHPSNIAQIVKGWPKKKTQKARPTLHLEGVVSRVTGVSQSDLRSVNLRGANGISKARAILSWLVRFKHPSLGYTEIARHLGGFDRATPRRGYEQVSQIVAAEQINTAARTQEIVKALWLLKWSERQA
jgi:transcriptional regulator